MYDEQVLAIDPGREKCGVAIVHPEQGVLFAEVVATGRLIDEAERLFDKYSFRMIVIGDGTSHREAVKRLALLKERQLFNIVVIDEKYSTEAARKRYWLENPPRGLRRLVPTSFQVPPEPVDAYVAVILAERYLAGRKEHN